MHDPRQLWLCIFYIKSTLDPSNEMNSLVLIVYKFDGVKDHSVLVHPHENAKRSDQPYRRTKQSTVNLLKVN